MTVRRAAGAGAAATLALYLALLAGLYLFQARAIYPGWWRGAGTPALPAGYRAFATRAADGQPGRLLFAPPRYGRPVILFFHGNGENVGGSAAAVARYVAAGYGAVLPEYRGYGGLPGAPSEQGLYRDARAARRWMAAHGLPPTRAIVMGYSLGTGVAVESAAEERPRALVLIAPFAGVARVAAARFPWVPVEWLLTERFDSLAPIGRIACPLLLVHGLADATVPVDNSRVLAARRPDATVALFPGIGHEIVWRPGPQALIGRWLDAH